jgi:hypothetical protein
MFIQFILERAGVRVFNPLFWRRVDVRESIDECWLWCGKVYRGYGKVKLNGNRDLLPHRLALAYTGVQLKRGYVVRHICNNPLCCNPRHLKQGTNFENSRDMRLSNRQARNKTSFSSNPMALKPY